MDLGGVKLLPEGVFVIWTWDWMEPSDDDSDSTRESAVNSPELFSNADDEIHTEETETIDKNPILTHTVTFKCIGSSRDPDCQECLAKAANIIRCGEHVDVKLRPEPTNEYDAKAIEFIIRLDNQWRRIGYVIKEVLDAVHDAIGKQQLATPLEQVWSRMVHWHRHYQNWRVAS